MSLKEIFIEMKLNYMFKSKLVIFLFRIGCMLKLLPKPIRFIFIPYFFIYKLLTEFFLGMELPLGTKVGTGLIIYHGFGIVINGKAVIGKNCVIRQGVTIGNKTTNKGVETSCPVIGNNVNIGAGSIIIGPINIGDNCTIGAGTVVVKNIIPNATVVSSKLIYLNEANNVQ